MCVVEEGEARSSPVDSGITAHHCHDDDGEIDPHHVQVDEAEPRHRRQSQSRREPF